MAPLDAAFSILTQPWVFGTIIFLFAFIIVYGVTHRSIRKGLHQFLVNRFFSLGSMIGFTTLLWMVFIEDFAHYTTILITAGFISLLFVRLKWANLKSSVKYFWIGVSYMIGAFAVFSALTLFPAITTMEGTFTFTILILMALTFLLRIIPAVRSHVWGVIVLGGFLATNAPGWLMIPRQFWIFTINLTEPIAWALTIVLIVLLCSLLYLTLHWLSESSHIASKFLLSPQLLFALGITCVVWGLMLGVFQWSL
jgi:hypothetical protein